MIRTFTLSSLVVASSLLLTSQAAQADITVFSETWETHAANSLTDTANGWITGPAIAGAFAAQQVLVGGTAPGGNQLSNAAFGRSDFPNDFAASRNDIGTQSSGVYTLTATLGQTESGGGGELSLNTLSTVRTPNNHIGVRFANENNGTSRFFATYKDSVGTYTEPAARLVVAGVDEPRNIDVRIVVDLDNDLLDVDWKFGDQVLYTSFINDFAIESSYTFSSISIYQQAPSGVDDVWIDDILLTTVPEPASLALLGGGLLALIRRRR